MAAKRQSMPFSAALEDALKKVNDPAWLGEHSMLASPYFLGARARGLTASRDRGQALRQLLLDAIPHVQGKYPERYRTILTEQYFNEMGWDDAKDKVGLARNSYNVNRRHAIDALAKALMARMHPTVRLDTPPAVREPLLRADDRNRLHRHLATSKTVAILGPEGAGKSMLVAQVIEQRAQPVFWYTVKPGINDTMERFAFALGAFAFVQGDPSLWLELLAEQGTMDAGRLFDRVHQTVRQLSPSLLLCIDELDQLDPTANRDHNALLQLWESIGPLASAIYISQRLVLDAEHHLVLDEIALEEADMLFRNHGMHLPEPDLARFHAWTRGNLSLLRLCASLLASGSEALTQMAASSEMATLEPLLAKTIELLSLPERRLLAKLSVFRRPAPLDLSRSVADDAAYHQLLEKQIIEVTPDGGVQAVSGYRAFVYTQLGEDARQRFHTQAADLRSGLGEYTVALHHLLRAGRVDEVIDLWSLVAQQEMEQGQGAAVLALFRQALTAGTLPRFAQEALTHACARLADFLGYADEALAFLEAMPQDGSPFSLDGLELRGKIENDLNNFDQAQQAFHRALALADARLEVRLARVHKGLAWMHFRQADLAQVELDLSHAEFEIENMRGNLATKQGRYADAITHYARAVTLARQIESANAEAKSQQNLAMIYMMRGQYDRCIDLLQRVCRHYDAMQRQPAMAGCRITLAVAHNLDEQHERALSILDAAEACLSPLETIPPWIEALLAQARAEAMLGLGQLSAAIDQVEMAIAANNADVLPDAYRTYGEILTRQERWEEAETYLRRSIASSVENADEWLHGYAWRALGRLRHAQGEPTKAARALARAAAIFESLNLPNEVARCQASLPQATSLQKRPQNHESWVVDEDGNGIDGDNLGALSVQPLTEEDVRDLLTWHYEPPYERYNLMLDDVDGAVAFFLLADNGYWAVRDGRGSLVGFCCFGMEGQVPGGDYRQDALDVGIGLRPSLTGRGMGVHFVATILSHAVETYNPDRLRATVAAFNRRSQRVFEQQGFLRRHAFVSTTDAPIEYVILVKDLHRGG